MENRFGVKDFFLFLVLSALIVLVVLGMFQYDRQWTVIQQTSNQLNNLTADVARIRRMMDQGALVAPANGPTTRPNYAAPLYTRGAERQLKVMALPDYAEGDDLIQTFGQPPDKLTPLINTDQYSSIVQSYVMDSLVGMDPDTFEWEPNLADSWSISDDQLTIDFILRKGIVFSDGSPFTADDVVYTFDLAKNPQLEAPGMQSMLDKLSSVEKVDDFHVRFHFSEPYFKSFDIAGGMSIMSKAFYSHYSITDINQSTGLLIGSSAYRLPDPTSWKPEPGKPIELVRNERYWGPRPSFNKIIWKVIENPTARATAFENGETDVYGILNNGPSPDQFDQMLHDKDLLTRMQHFALDSPVQGYFYIGWNEKHGRDGPPSYFADKRVRKAMTMLVDRQAIVRDILHGYASVAVGPFSPLSPQTDHDLKPMPYDPAGAQKLLADAGFVKKGDILYGPDGKPFEFKLTYAVVRDMYARIVPLIHDSCAQVGINVIPDPQEWSVLLQRKDDRNFDAIMAGWGGDAPNEDLYQIFDSHFISGTGDDDVQYQNKELDALIEKARVTRDVKERNDLWKKTSDIIFDDQPYTFLFNDQELSVVDKRIKGLVPTKVGLNSIAEWYVPLKDQKYHD
ncbi:MAG: ABC transporter substrate-binding protein [Tepidisphaeraceae bacterium]|jgi:peptide/nickel transport system substrate-binding protein